MLQPYFDWLNNLAISRYIGESALIYPVVQAVHLVFLALLFGGILMVDLRLMGKGLTTQTTAEVERQARPWVMWGLIGMILTGVPQLMQNATREYHSEFFWYKMYLLPLVLVIHFTLRRRIAMAPEGSVSPFAAKAVGGVSTLLWLMIAISSRFIGLFT